FATASGLMTPAAVWRRDGKERAPAKAVNAVPVRWFHRELIEGNPVFFRHSTAVHGEAPKLLETFELPIHVELLAQPVQTHLETGAVVMLMSYDRRALMLRDTSELLTTIGSFFATEWARATADKELRRYERRLRELATNLTESDERVRRHTSVDLHDGLIQQLAVARMKLGELRYRRVSSPDTIDNLTAIIDDTLATTRRIVQKLSPSVLYELGLAPGIQTLCDKATETGGIPVELTEEGDRRSLSEPLMVSLYEVVRELIDNSQKHSGGQNIWVHIVWGQESLRYISVSDDGVHERWWSEEASSSEGLGLLSNSERLRSFGFTTLFGERAGGGTKATVITDAGRYNRGNVAS
ncbi:MAG: histidine kinase, partial [Pseudomonadota bacterium]